MTEASDRVEEQAAQRLIQIESTGSPDHWIRLDTWLAAHPKHRAVFLRLSYAWRRANGLALFRSASRNIDEDALDRCTRHLRRLGRDFDDHGSALAAAAGIAALAISIGIGGSTPFQPRSAITAQFHETKEGQRASFALTDGSRLALNTASRVLVRYGEHLRELTLVEGEAAVFVRADPQRPFELHAGATTFRVLGTAFSVRVRRDGSIDISVTEGRVAVESDGILGPGDVATIQGATIHKRKVPLEILAQRLAWTHGRLFFDGETLGLAAAEFNRYNRLQLVIADRNLAALRIFGTFESDDPQMFVAALEEPFGISQQALADGKGGTIIRLERHGT